MRIKARPLYANTPMHFICVPVYLHLHLHLHLYLYLHHLYLWCWWCWLLMVLVVQVVHLDLCSGVARGAHYMCNLYV